MQALQRGGAWAEERLLGALRQSVPQNGRVHLHIKEGCSDKVGGAAGILVGFQFPVQIPHSCLLKILILDLGVT